VIAGVAGGLGRYFDIDPVIARIAFAVSILFGGLGVIAYIAAAIFVPSDDGTGSPAPTSRGQTIARGTGLVLLAILALCGVGTLVAAAAFVTGLGYGLVVAGAIVAIGILLVALSFRGSAKWLIVPALALSIGVGVAAAADLDLEGGVGKRTYSPTSAAAIPVDGYELGVGRLAVDLRQIDWSPERRLELDARVGAGEMLIAVPSDVCVVADAHAGAGEIRVAGQEADGFDVDLVTAGGSLATPQLQLDADVDMGAIRVINDDDADIDDQGQWDRWDHYDEGEGSLAREANQKACAG
jgi:phage shock protein PspC (stress-responsive transcriptional regulator)